MGEPGVEPFDRATLDRFFAAVLVNDVVDPVLTAPDTVPLLHPADRLADYHRLCRQTWAEGLDRAGLTGVAWTAMVGRRPEARVLTAFKHVRAKFKQLRYATALCDRRGRTPFLLNHATVLMGQVQDACRNGQRGRARLCGMELRAMVSGPPLARIAAQVGRVRMIDPAAFADRLDADLDGLAGILSSDSVTGHRFHAARKVVSRHNSFWTAMAVLHPGPDHHRLFRWMSAINGAMGAYHDGLVARRACDASSYCAAFPLPDEVAVPLARLLALPRRRG